MISEGRIIHANVEEFKVTQEDLAIIHKKLPYLWAADEIRCLSGKSDKWMTTMIKDGKKLSKT